MWATMKYVSWMKMSTGVEAMKMPESPPITNMPTKASAFRSDRAAEHDVVDVGNDEVRVLDEDVDRRRGHEDAGEPADHEHAHEGQRVPIGSSRRTRRSGCGQR